MTRHQPVRSFRSPFGGVVLECDCGEWFPGAKTADAYETQIAHALDALKAPSVFASLDEARAT